MPNPSFEEYIICPFYPGEMYNVENWSSFGNSSDYYNACANNGNPITVGVPYNNFGFQYASDGNAYVGLFTFYPEPFAYYREYVGVQLLQPLIIGRRYCLSFDVNLTLGFYANAIASNNMGVTFTTIEYSETNPIPTNNNPHLNWDSIIEDTLNWTKLSWHFTPDSEYQYMALGNFFTNENTDTIDYQINNGKRSYYLIDNVSLIECDSIISATSESYNNFKAWPNPVIDYLNFYCPQKIKKINLLDTMNENRLEIEYHQPIINPTIDLSFLPSGVYTALIIMNNNSKKIYKIIKI